MRYLWSIKWWASKVFAVCVSGVFFFEEHIQLPNSMTDDNIIATGYRTQQTPKKTWCENVDEKNRLQRWYSTTNINHSTEWWLSSIDWFLKALHTHRPKCTDTFVARCFQLEDAISLSRSVWCDTFNVLIVSSETFC